MIGSKNLKSPNTRVVYHLHKQTGRYTVWANGKKNSGLESGLSFAQISSAEIGMKHNFLLMEHEFPLGIFGPKNRPNFSDVQLLPEIFHWNDKKRKLFVNGKQLLGTGAVLYPVRDNTGRRKLSEKRNSCLNQQITRKRRN